MVASMKQQTIDVGTISVPKSWEEQGFTSSVAATRLRDAINQIIDDADSSSPPPRFGGAGPAITIHEVWFQPEAIARWLGTWLALRQDQNVSGEITMNRCEAQLRIRYNGNQQRPTVPYPSVRRPANQQNRSNQLRKAGFRRLKCHTGSNQYKSANQRRRSPPFEFYERQ
jgi:hypothetical protein